MLFIMWYVFFSLVLHFPLEKPFNTPILSLWWLLIRLFALSPGDLTCQTGCVLQSGQAVAGRTSAEWFNCLLFVLMISWCEYFLHRVLSALKECTNFLRYLLNCRGMQFTRGIKAFIKVNCTLPVLLHHAYTRWSQPRTMRGRAVSRLTFLCCQICQS